MEVDKIAKAIANVALFLEFASEDALHPDDTVQALEQLSSDLNELDEKLQRDLSAAFRSMATEYQGKERKFVDSLPDAFGLDDAVIGTEGK